jgi:hypothetical protein
MKIVLFVIVIGIALSGCQAQSWQPYAALYQPPNPQPTNEPQPMATSAATARAACEVTARKSLNLRGGAGTIYGVIGVLSAGEILTLTGNQRGAWLQVATSAGVIGWVNSKYCKGK